MEAYALAPTVASVPEARRLADEVARPLLAPEQLENLSLAVSEIVTNAILHGGEEQEILLRITPKDGYLCVQVTDDGDGFVPRPGAMGRDGGGYGLFLVERAVRRWGITREGGRTRVWFELDY